MKDYNGFPAEQRTRAGQWLKAEIAAGRLSPPAACMACGIDSGVIDFHAEDYSEPFGPHVHAFQLCYRCHLMWHGRHKRMEGWEAYAQALRDGFTFPPVPKRDLAWVNDLTSMMAVLLSTTGRGEPRRLIFDFAPFTK